MADMADEEEIAAGADIDYFKSYSDLEGHKLMLKDRARILAYKNFIENNSWLIKDKVVLDVGAGSGILSLFVAKAGAKKVFAVEASDIADVGSKIIQANNYQDVIEVVKGTTETVELAGVAKVDVIVSEWMGFYLLHESLLDSVLFARDKWLKPGGVMLPSYCTIHMAPVDMTEYRKEHFECWQEIYGFDLSPIQNYSMLESLKQPLVTCVKPEHCLAKAEVVAEFDLQTVKVADIQELEEKLAFDVEKNSVMHGFAVWFDVDFNPTVELVKDKTNSAAHVNDKTNCTADVQNLTLSTSPSAEETHWKQTVVFLPAILAVSKGDTIFSKISLRHDTTNKRHYNISIEMRENLEDTDDEDYDDDEEEEDTSSHPMPCECDAGRCQLIKAIMEKNESEQTELEMEAEFTDIKAEVQAAQTMDKDSSYLDAEVLANDGSCSKDDEANATV